MRAKSVKKKEKGSTKDIAGKRLRTKNANSVAGRAVYSNPSPYANERKGKDRVAKPIGGQPARIRSRSAESARNNVYPQSGPFVNRGSTRSETGRSNRSQSTRSGKLSTRRTASFGGSVNPPRSRSRSAETSRANAYPQKGPFVNQSSRQTQRPGSKSQATRRGRLSTNARTSRGVRVSSPRSRSSSAESAKGKRFQQTGSFVNRSSKNTETVSSGSNRYSRRTKLSAGPNPPGKKRIITPRSASQQYVTRGRKDVYWGKFSKGEKAITTDISGNPLRRRNYRTPPNEPVKPKNPYEGRKKSSGDRAYSGTFRSGHVSGSNRTEKAWMGDVSGQPIRKRSSRQTEIAGKKTTGPAKAGGSISASGKYRSNRPFKAGVGSVSASGRYRSNKPLNGRAGSSLSSSSKNRTNSFRPQGGGSISASGKYRSNQPFKGGGGSVSASARYRSNKPLNGRTGSSLSISNKNRSYNYAPKGGGSISASGKYRSNKPFKGGIGSISASARYRSNKPLNGRRGSSLSVSNQNRSYDYAPKGGGSISASGRYRSNKPFNNRIGSLSVSGKNRTYDFKQKGGGSISASGKYRSNQPYNNGGGGSITTTGDYRSNKSFKNRIGPLSVSGQNRTYDFQPKGGGSISGKVWNNDNKPIEGRTLKIGASAMATFQGNAKIKEPKKGGGSISGKLWNNNGKPIEGRTPSQVQAAAASYSGRTKLPFFKRAYVRNPNAVEKALKKESPLETVYMADGLQVAVKAKQTGTKPKAVKGSMPGLAPTKATVKASEYSRSMKMYWSYKHNPSSADLSLKTIAPGRAYARIVDYQGNVKMSKYKDKRFLPDAKFAHGNQNNVKEERTMMTDFKLLWTKIFKKNGTQPTAVKEKPVRPRYDKRERELWPGLYD